MYDDPYFPYEHKQGGCNIFRHPGFRMGFLGGFILVCVHLILLLLFRFTNQGDVLGWLLGWFVYFMIGRAAAQQKYDSQRDTMNPTGGVVAAGAGAALVTSVIVWIYVILRGVFRDYLGMFIIVEPISLFCVMVIDGLVAFGLGSAGGRSIARKYEVNLPF